MAEQFNVMTATVIGARYGGRGGLATELGIASPVFRAIGSSVFTPSFAALFGRRHKM
jgi:hypothetical protein